MIIAGAGGAAHLPGMVASATVLPVIGVPVPLATLDGMDSLLSIVQMPAGIPVACVSIGGARQCGPARGADPGRCDRRRGGRLAARLAGFADDLQRPCSASTTRCAERQRALDRPVQRRLSESGGPPTLQVPARRKMRPGKDYDR